MITALNNKGVKRIIALKKSSKDRKKEGTFIVEGTRMFDETPDELIKSVYVTPDYQEKCGIEEKKRLERLNPVTVSGEVFSKMSDTITPQGILVEVTFPKNNVRDIIHNDNAFLLCLQDIQDPGNLGTMLRTAEGAGITGIIMSRGCVDIYSPKVVRSTMGAIFRMPFAYTEDLEDTVECMKQLDISVYAAALHNNSVPYTDRLYDGKCAILIGNEGNGLTREIIGRASKSVVIPMSGQLESLNAAISAGIIMYEARRQREQ